MPFIFRNGRYLGTISLPDVLIIYVYPLELPDDNSLKGFHEILNETDVPVASKNSKRKSKQRKAAIQARKAIQDCLNDDFTKVLFGFSLWSVEMLKKFMFIKLDLIELYYCNY